METIDEITIRYEEEGVELVKEIEKVVLSKGGAWVTIMFRYIQWENTNQAYSEDKYTIRRYKKSNGEYRQQSKFNISNKAQAQKLVETLSEWIAE